MTTWAFCVATWGLAEKARQMVADGASREWGALTIRKFAPRLW